MSATCDKCYAYSYGPPTGQAGPVYLCPLHAGATALADLLRDLVEYSETNSFLKAMGGTGLVGNAIIRTVVDARILLARIDGAAAPAPAESEA